MISKMWVGIVAVLLGLATLGGCSNTSSSPETPASASPSASIDATAQATSLVNQYLTLLKDGDTAGLEQLLSPAFQVIRADGSTADKTAYLADPPQIEDFTVSDVVATQDATVLVARYTVTTTETINGETYSNAPAPRLSAFVQQGDTWQLIAHANLNTPDAASEPTTASPSPVSEPAQSEVAEQVQVSVEAFYQALVDEDGAAIDDLLSPAFQIVRADGSHANKTEYLAAPAKMASFQLTDWAITAENEAAVARYLGATQETIDDQDYGTEPALRMAVLHNTGDVWQIVALVNLNTPAS